MLNLLVCRGLRRRNLAGCGRSTSLLPITRHKDSPQAQEDDIEECVQTEMGSQAFVVSGGVVGPKDLLHSACQSLPSGGDERRT